jgi:hypothetical protein
MTKNGQGNYKGNKRHSYNRNYRHHGGPRFQGNQEANKQGSGGQGGAPNPKISTSSIDKIENKFNDMFKKAMGELDKTAGATPNKEPVINMNKPTTPIEVKKTPPLPVVKDVSLNDIAKKLDYIITLLQQLRNR